MFVYVCMWVLFLIFCQVCCQSIVFFFIFFLFWVWRWCLIMTGGFEWLLGNFVNYKSVLYVDFIQNLCWKVWDLVQLLFVKHKIYFILDFFLLNLNHFICKRVVFYYCFGRIFGVLVIWVRFLRGLSKFIHLFYEFCVNYEISLALF